MIWRGDKKGEDHKRDGLKKNCEVGTNGTRSILLQSCGISAFDTPRTLEYKYFRRVYCEYCSYSGFCAAHTPVLVVLELKPSMLLTVPVLAVRDVLDTLECTRSVNGILRASVFSFPEHCV